MRACVIKRVRPILYGAPCRLMCLRLKNGFKFALKKYFTLIILQEGIVKNVLFLVFLFVILDWGRNNFVDTK